MSSPEMFDSAMFELSLGTWTPKQAERLIRLIQASTQVSDAKDRLALPDCLAHGPTSPLVGILEHKGRALVACQNGVYELYEGRWCRMAFEETPLTIRSDA